MSRVQAKFLPDNVTVSVPAGTDLLQAAALAGQLRVRSLPPPARPTTGPRPDPRTEADGTPRWSGPDGLGLAGWADRLVAERSGSAGPVEPRTS